jgi:tRNA threonylcarbamoyladenosine biosynthesis protein TsaB
MKLLALDTSTDTMSLAVQHGAQVFTHSGAGGAQASSALLPAVQQLMQQAALRFDALDAIAFGAGPGSFTGLRTACAVAQGLGFASGVQLLPVSTLLNLAWQAQRASGHTRVLALLDARMGEVYAQYYDFDSWLRNKHEGQWLVSPKNLNLHHSPTGLPMQVQLLCGNVFDVYASDLPASDVPRHHALPSAQALLELAPTLIAQGGLVNAEQALPTYVRDKVALTTQERLQTQAATPS